MGEKRDLRGVCLRVRACVWCILDFFIASRKFKKKSPFLVRIIFFLYIMILKIYLFESGELKWGLIVLNPNKIILIVSLQFFYYTALQFILLRFSDYKIYVYACDPLELKMGFTGGTELAEKIAVQIVYTFAIKIVLGIISLFLFIPPSPLPPIYPPFNLFPPLIYSFYEFIPYSTQYPIINLI